MNKTLASCISNKLDASISNQIKKLIALGEQNLKTLKKYGRFPARDKLLKRGKYSAAFSKDYDLPRSPNRAETLAAAELKRSIKNTEIHRIQTARTYSSPLIKIQEQAYHDDSSPE
jgi:hypothetical protein